MTSSPATPIASVDSLLDRVSETSPRRAEIASRVADWVFDNPRLRADIWTSESGGSLRVFRVGSDGYAVFKVTADGKIEILFDTLKHQPEDMLGCSLELFRTNLNQIPEVEFAKASLETWKTFPLEAIGEAADFQRFVASIDSLVS